MKILLPNFNQITVARASSRAVPHAKAGFTMMEIAISLAVIGIALVAIIGILPYGMNTQRDNREQTVINQDATMLLEAIRSGSRGLDDLTNYVFAVTNYLVSYSSNGTPTPLQPIGGTNGFPSFLTNGFNIIGLLSTPEFTDLNGVPIANITGVDYVSNHVVAYVHSMSGPAIEKPPQDNDILRQDSFSYKIFCVNAPLATDTNVWGLPQNQQAYAKQLGQNLHELRLTFLWPLRPNMKIGSGRWTYRTLIAGQLTQTNIGLPQYLYFYKAQSFTNAP